LAEITEILKKKSSEISDEISGEISLHRIRKNAFKLEIEKRSTNTIFHGPQEGITRTSSYNTGTEHTHVQFIVS